MALRRQQCPACFVVVKTDDPKDITVEIDVEQV
jgi:hypothetical protein